MATGLEVLPSGAGYGIVVGIGGVFAILMLFFTWLQNRYTSFSTRQAEEFTTASRSVKPGLIAAGIVSSWTWSATLLTSSTFTYSYGVSGGMWYGAMGTLQIMLFALIAIKIKANVPGAHTFPEIVLAKHGKIAHLTYLFMGLATNMLVGACLVLGGSQVVAAISGMNVYAACFLIPLVVAAYVIAGGLRSTFIADYIHTVILFIAIFVFGFLMYATSDQVGSLEDFYNLLQKASKTMPIARNHEGSYLTFRSVDGLVFAIDLFVAGFSTVWLDQAYWQRAIASRPESSVKAYLFGGIAWYGIPSPASWVYSNAPSDTRDNEFGFATAMGLGCAALTSNPAFPTYPDPLSASQSGQGLSSPATAITLLGKGGAVLMLILLFMAVTSSTSAELIAVSSLLTFDVYKTYIKPNSSSASLVQISHYGIVLYGLVLAAFCCILNAVGLTLTWLLTVLGIIVGGASVPVGLILLWSRMSTVAAVFAPWIGLSAGLIAWFVTTAKRSGKIDVTTTGDTTNAVAGNITSWGTGFLVAVMFSVAFPAKHVAKHAKDVERYNKIHGLKPLDGEKVDSNPTPEPGLDRTNEQKDNQNSQSLDLTRESKSENPIDGVKPATIIPTGNELVDYLETQFVEPMDPVMVKKGERIAVIANVVFILVAIILVPFTLFGTEYIFNKAFFSGFVVVSFIWVWVSMAICVIWPVVESRGALREICKGLLGDIMALLGKKKTHQASAHTTPA